MEINVNVTPALHPDNIKAIDGYNEETADAVAEVIGAFEAAYVGLTKIHEARTAAKENPTLTEAAQVLVVADFAEKQFKKMAGRFDAALAQLNAAISEGDREFRQPLESASVGGWTSEVRAHVKKLAAGDRRTFMLEAVEGGDTKTLGAVLGAPTFLSGITPAEREHYTRMHHERINPALARRLAVMKAAQLLAYERSALIHGEIDKAIGTDRSNISKLRAARAKAEKAYTFAP